MNTKELLQAVREVFPGSTVLPALDANKVQEKTHGQPIYCNYHDSLRAVDRPVCEYHLKAFDPWCWERWETEWAIRRRRPAIEAAYRQHKKSGIRFSPMGVGPLTPQTFFQPTARYSRFSGRGESPKPPPQFRMGPLSGLEMDSVSPKTELHRLK